jgi:hypothetical protein
MVCFENYIDKKQYSRSGRGCICIAAPVDKAKKEGKIRFEAPFFAFFAFAVSLFFKNHVILSEF